VLVSAGAKETEDDRESDRGGGEPGPVAHYLLALNPICRSSGGLTPSVGQPRGNGVQKEARTVLVWEHQVFAWCTELGIPESLCFVLLWRRRFR